MKSLITTLLLAITLSSTVFADDFDDALAAYKKGDYKTALKLWKPLAEQGAANAQVALGAIYGSAGNDKEAVKWYQLAAEQGDAKAQAVLAYMYGEGDGISEDNKQAVKWYQLAAYIQAKRRSWCYVDEGGGSKKMISKLLSDID